MKAKSYEINALCRATKVAFRDSYTKRVIPLSNRSNIGVIYDLITKEGIEHFGSKYSKQLITVCDTPKILLGYGFNEHEIVIQPGTIEKCIYDHGITKSFLQDLEHTLSNPLALFESAMQHNSSVVLSFQLQRGDPIIIPIQKDWAYGRGQYNRIATIFGKPQGIIDKWGKEGLLLWENPSGNKKA